MDVSIESASNVSHGVKVYGVFLQPEGRRLCDLNSEL